MAYATQSQWAGGFVATRRSVSEGTWTSSDAVPTAFTLNGTACTT